MLKMKSAALMGGLLKSAHAVHLAKSIDHGVAPATTNMLADASTWSLNSLAAVG